MASSQTTIHDDGDGPVTQRASGTHPAQRAVQRPSDDEAAALIRRSLEMLDDVHQLLRTLSPTETQTAVARMFPGGAGDENVRLCWKLYAYRHRLLRMHVFAQQHSEFVHAAREHLARTSQCPEEPR
jgi:hypothetical protein